MLPSVIKTQKPPTGPSELKKNGQTIEASINHSRWIVSCPACNSAQIGDPDDQQFYCVECGAGVYKVKYPPPSKRTEIESLLATIPFPQNRNWEPHESVAYLAKMIEQKLG